MSEHVSESAAPEEVETSAPTGQRGRFYQASDPSEPIPDPYSLPIEDINKNADEPVMDRRNARQHLSFGFDLHRKAG